MRQTRILCFALVGIMFAGVMADAQLPTAASACVLVVTGLNENIVSTISCDGRQVEQERPSRVPINDVVSGKLATITQMGLHLASCQLRNTGVSSAVEYFCAFGK